MNQRLIMAASLLLSLPLIAHGQNVYANSIVVRGEAVNRVSPDALVWTVALEREAGSRERAEAALDSETKRVREVGMAVGLRESDLTVTRMRVQRKDGRYVARRTLTLSQNKPDGAFALMERLKAIRPAKLSYRLEHSNRKQLERETQNQAVANARLQANGVAQGLGATLGRVVAVENEFGAGSAFGTRPRFSTYETMPLEHASAETFANAKIRVHASVYVTYSIGAAVAVAG